MLRRLLATVVVLLAAGCAGTPPQPSESELRVRALLDQVAAHYAEEGASRCLSTSRYRSVEIVDEQRLIFHRGREVAWLNQLRHRCQGLRPGDTLLFEFHDGRACELDSISEIDRFIFWTRTGPTCTLGDFKPIPPETSRAVFALLRNDGR